MEVISINLVQRECWCTMQCDGTSDNLVSNQQFVDVVVFASTSALNTLSQLSAQSFSSSFIIFAKASLCQDMGIAHEENNEA